MRYLLVLLTLLFPLNLFALSSNTHSIDLERGSDQYLYRTDASQVGLDFTGDFTIAVWVNMESLPANDTQRTVVAKRLSQGYGLILGKTAGGQFRYRTYVDDGTLDTKDFNKADPSLSTWYHLVFRFTSSSKEHSFWINGVEETPQTGTRNPVNGSNPFVIGGDTLDANNAFDGLIDDVRVWSRALGDSEVTALYTDACNASNGASLQGWWVLDNALTDTSGNGNDLTNNNSAVFSTTHPYDCTAAAAETSNDLLINNGGANLNNGHFVIY